MGSEVEEPSLKILASFGVKADAHESTEAKRTHHCGSAGALDSVRTHYTEGMRFNVTHPLRTSRLFALLGGCLAVAEASGCSAEPPTLPPTDAVGGSGGTAQPGAGTGGSAGQASGGTPAATTGGTGGSGGAVATGGAGGSGGSSAGAGAIGGAAGSSGGSGGAGPAGAGGTAGVMTSGGSAGRASGGRGGQGGGNAGTSAAAGSGAGGSSGASTGMAVPSEGCGKGARPSGGKVEVANTSLYLFPADYDGTKPYPLLIALHACGNPNTEFVSLTNGTAFETGYVRIFPNTPDSGQCWSNYSGDMSRIGAQYDEVMSKYCIDKSRVFAIAHSSGAQMLVNILSHKTDAQHLNLKGISPVAADPYNVAVPMPVLYIDGQMDNQRSADSAKNTVAKFRASNSCMDTSKPYTAVMQCNSTESGHPAVNPGCNIYDGCSVPTIWCAHNDPSYSGTQHGVPCFAMKAMVDFFAGL